MQLIGILLLIITSWYIWKLSSNFFDDQTKKEISDNSQIFKKQLDETLKKFSKENLKELWKKYKDESKNITNQEK